MVAYWRTKVLKNAILQYFWPALSNNSLLVLKTNFGIFESGLFTQVLLYRLYALMDVYRMGLHARKPVFSGFETK